MKRARAAADTRRSLDKVLGAYREVRGGRPQQGWIRAVRNALGMTAAQLGERLGMAQPTLHRLELSEIKDTIQLGSLRRVAAALDCRLVYAFVPREADSLQALYEAAALQVVEGLENESGADEDRLRRFIDEDIDPHALWAALSSKRQ